MNLLPCPFCGGDARLQRIDEAPDNGTVVGCTQCAASTALVFGVKADPSERARDLWNRRARTEVERRVVNAVRRYLGYEPDYKPTDAEIADAVESMFDGARAWLALRDEAERQKTSVEQKRRGRAYLDSLRRQF